MDRNMATPAKIEPWMVEAVKEMMVKHLGFGAVGPTNWMLLESDLVAIIAGHAPEQEPGDLAKYIPTVLVCKAACKTILDTNVLEAFLTALNLARDTKQEPSVPEGWRERAQECVTGFYASSERYQTDSYGGVAIEILRVMLEKQL